MSHPTHEQARLNILWSVTQFMLSRTYGDGKSHGAFDAEYSFRSSLSGRDVPIGSLVVPTSAPVTKWYLGWLREIKRPEGYACDVYVIESIEDGTLCDWANIGLMYLPPEIIAKHPRWSWSDREAAFNSRWVRACEKDRDAYIYLPIQADFRDDSVTLGVRVRHAFSKETTSKTFPNWKRVTRKMMLEFYDESVIVLTKPAARQSA